MSATARLRRRASDRVLPLLIVGALSLTACSGADTADDDASADDAVAATEDVEPAESTPDLSGEPPAELVVEQLEPPPDANAPEARPGDVVVVDYVGRSFSSGEVFDSSEGREPFTFELGAGDVIPGWDQGIAGLQVGERARLTIPPDLAYGEVGAGTVIGSNETLVFDVHLVDILAAAAPTDGPPTEGQEARVP